MKKRKRFLAIVMSFLMITTFAQFLVQANTGQPRHAPNMYVDWPDNGDYDVMLVDWYCEQDARNTYWAVHNWDGGYAGFQNKNGSHVLLLSLWDLDDGTTPTVEYVMDGQSGNFGGEGTGKQAFTNYNWQTGKWYSMRVQVWNENGKSCYGQWIREGDGVWVKTAVISYPKLNRKFDRSSMFQEDFTFNNLSRKCRMKNAYGRFYGTTNWDSWSNFKISNTYFPTDPPTWDNVQRNETFDSDWGKSSDGSYVWVQSGGASDFASNGKTIPITYSVNQAATPSSPNVTDANLITSQPTPAPQSTPESTYTLYYNANGGSGAPPSQTKKRLEDWTVSFIIPTRDGYDFEGWAYSPDEAVWLFPGAAFGEWWDVDYTLYAIWKAIPVFTPTPTPTPAPTPTPLNGITLTQSNPTATVNVGAGVNGRVPITLTAPSGNCVYIWSSSEFPPGSDPVLYDIDGGLIDDDGAWDNNWQYVIDAGRTMTVYAGTYDNITASYIVTADFSGYVPSELLYRESDDHPSYNTADEIAANTVAFSDVSEIDVYYEAITSLAANGAISGYPDGTFRPDNTITRAEFATILIRACGLLQEALNDNGLATFDDVGSSHWAARYISLAYKKGIIDGYGDGNFGPEDEVTFEQVIKMVICELGYKEEAMQNGGYPTGFLIEGIALKISDNMSFAGSSPAGRGTVALLLFNAYYRDK